MLKKITALGLVLVMAFSVFCLPASADEDGTRYLYTYNCSTNLSISSLNATCTRNWTDITEPRLSALLRAVLLIA